jgi:hypothetical protein
MATDLHVIETANPELIDPSQEAGGSIGASTRALWALWYQLMQLSWSTLALVEPDDGARAWRVAQALVHVADKHPLPLKAVNVVGASPARVAALANVLSPERLQARANRPRFVLAVDSPLGNPPAIVLLSACDVVVLCLERRRTRIPDGQRTVELIGRERIVGAVLCSD